MSEQQKLLSVHYGLLKGLKDVTINFTPKEVTGIFGVNGCGKSTILHSLLCLYKPKDDATVDYKFSNFFKTTTDLNWVGSTLSAKICYRDNAIYRTDERNYSKGVDRWSPKYGRRPDRCVFFLGVNTSVPDIEEFSKTPMGVDLGTPTAIERRDEILRAASSIMNYQYIDLQDQPVKSSKKKCRIVSKSVSGSSISYTSLNMGAGEQRMFRIIETIVSAPKYSLIIIDEIDLTLHTAALNRLMDFIVQKANQNKLQVVFTSHREELVYRKDINIRHLIQINGETLCLENTTPECVDRITGTTSRTLDVFVEDDLGEAIASQLCTNLNIRKRVSIHRFGDAGNAFIASVGMDISGTDTSNMLFVLDGDVYRTDAEKLEMMKNKYSGTEQAKEDRRNKALSIITQFDLPDGLAPEQYIWSVLREMDGDTEVISSAKSINGVSNTHEYLDRIIDSLGDNRDVALMKIIDEFSHNNEKWNVMTANVANWLNKKKEDLNL